MENNDINWTVMHGDTADFEQLRNAGIDINSVHPLLGTTPLYRVADWNRTELGLWLLEHGANPNSSNPTGNRPLHRTSFWRNIPFSHELILHGAELDVRNALGHTPLHIAAQWGCEKMIKLLVKAGASIDIYDSNEERPRTPIELTENSLIRRYFLNRGQATFQLFKAVQTSDSVVAKYALRKGAQLNACDSDNNTPLHRACARYDIPMIGLLLQFVPQIRLDIHNNNNETALMLAISNREIVGRLRQLIKETEKTPDLP